MVLKAFDFSLSSDGIHESFHESDGAEESSSAKYLIVCDAISSSDEDGADSSAHSARILAEQTINEYFTQIHEGELSEETLKRALAHANRRLLQLFDDDEESVAVSAAILAAGQADEVLMAGVGDIQIYSVGAEGLTLAFRDPQTPEVGTALAPNERYLSLHNALAVGDSLEIASKALQQGDFQRYLIATYGCYRELSKDKLLELGLRPHHKEKGAKVVFETLTAYPHCPRLCTASYELETAASVSEAPSTTPYHAAPVQNRRRQRAAALTLSAMVCSMVVYLSYESLSSTPTPSLAESPSIEDTQLVAKADPFQAEAEQDNSWVVALKEQ